MKAHAKNSGPATVDVNSLGVKNVKKIDGSDLKQGDIPLDGVITLVYDGAQFQLANSAVDREQTTVNTSNIMRAFGEIQENHGGSLLMEAGWSDSFGNANEQGADEANSSGYQHDATNKLYKGTDPGLGLNSDKNYDTESDYLQQEWTNSNQTTSQATVASGATVTLSSGVWPTNCENSRISFNSGTSWFDIENRDSDTQLALVGDLTAWQTYSASANNSAGENESKAFDDNSATYWNPTNSTNVPEWIKVQFNSATVVNKITVEWMHTAVYTYTFSGSNDDISYTTLLTINAKSYSGDTVTPEVFSNTLPYIHYRLEITGFTAGPNLVLREMEMFHIPSDGTSDYIIRMSEFDSNSLKLNGASNTQSGIAIQSTRLATTNGYPMRGTGSAYHATGSRVIADAIPVGQKLTRVDIVLIRVGNPTGNLFMKVFGATDVEEVNTHVNNADNHLVETSANTIASSSITTSGTTTKYSFYFSGTHKFEPDKTYFFLVEPDTAMSGGTEILVPNNQTNEGMQAIGQAYYYNPGANQLTQLANYFNQVIDVHTIGDGYPTSEYVSICDSESKKTNTSGWLDINSGSAIETLSKENAYYWLALDPASSLGDGTEIKIGNYSTGATTIDGNTSLDTTVADSVHVYVDRTIAVENNKWITHIGLKMEYDTIPLTSLKIFRENSTSDFDVLYSQDIIPYDNSATTPWYQLTTPFLTPTTGTLRIGAFYSGGSGRLTLNNEDATSGNSYYWSDSTNLAVGNHSGSWTASTNRLVIGYKNDAFSTGWRTIAKNESNVWKYNNSASGTTYTSATATTNDMLHAISEALSSQSANRMSKIALTVMVDSDWEASGGWSTSVDNILRGVTFHSNNLSQTSSVSQYQLNYDSERNPMDFRSKAYDPDFVPTEGYVWSQIEHSDSDGPGTFYVSRNGGTEWATVPMTQQGLPLSGDIRIYRGTVDVSGQTSGQDLRCRHQTEQGKDQFLHSWGLQAKP
jgi:hypothetical protein